MCIRDRHHTNTRTNYNKSKHNAALQTKRKLEQINLNNIINYLYHKKDTLNRQAYNLHMKLTQILHHTELENVIQHTQDNIEKLKSIIQD